MKQLHNIICVAWYKSTWNLVRWARWLLCVFAFGAALVAGVWLFGYDAMVIVKRVSFGSLSGMVLAQSKIELLTFAGVVIAGVFAWWQWRKSREMMRIEYFKKLVDEFKQDDFQEFFYEYLSPANGRRFYIGMFAFVDGVEKRLDQILTFYSNICYLKEKGVLEESEFALFRYQIQKALKNAQVIEYFTHLAERSSMKTDSCPFLPLFREGRRFDDYSPAYRDLCKEMRTKKKYKKWLAEQKAKSEADCKANNMESDRG